jgi:hypothetical protein
MLADPRNSLNLLPNSIFFRYNQHLFKTMKPFFGEHSLSNECPLCPQVSTIQLDTYYFVCLSFLTNRNDIKYTLEDIPIDIIYRS